MNPAVPTPSPGQPLSDEDVARLARWNDTAHPYPDRATVHELFDLQADATPDRTALIYGDERLTFADLQRRANGLAHMLIGKGVGPGTPVGVAMYRSPGAIVGLLAIIKAGGAYLPLDPSYPDDRLSLMVSDADVGIILTSSDVDDFPATQAEMIDILRFDANAHPSDSPPIQTKPDDPLYVTFTSGSTGRPNGVLGTHRGAINRFNWAWESYPFAEGEVCCQKTSLNFVDHLSETWAPLLKGHALVVVPDEVVKDGGRFIDILAEHRIERLVTVPSLMSTLLQAIPDMGAKLSNLRFCTLSGERLTVELANEFSTNLPDTVLLNLYGMSEGSGDATWYDQRWGNQSDSFPIGRPIHNMHVYVLDRDRRPVPIGEPGEIYLGGVGLALGYLGRPELTVERFLPNPFVDDPAARMYRSGDLGRWLPDGVLEFVGRVDHQVKVRGVRIELGDVEAAARSLDEVTEAVVTAPVIGHDRRLVAYVTLAPGASATATVIRGALAARLPGTMVPTRIIFVDHFPLTPNGKVDRSALPDPVGERPATDTPYAPPRTDVERQLVAIWQELLFIDRISVNDSFFDLGGDSLLVVLLRAQLHESFGIALAAPLLFEHRTIHQLATLIEALREPAPGPHEDATPAFGQSQRPRTTGTDVAIIGMAGRFPGASDIDRFWDNLVHGVEGLRRLTDEELQRWEPGYEEKAGDPDFVPVVGTLDDVELFDADFFGIQPGEARTLDPQHRIWFEAAWQALEHGGYAPGKTDHRIGVFAGSYMNTYAMHNLLHDRASVDEFVRLHGPASLLQSLNNEPDYLPTRTSHLLDLRGPSVNVQTACSTSLVAVALACRAIASGDCEMALAGGVTVLLPQAQGYYYQSGGIRSVDGHCRPFDAAGTGTIFTSGVGAVLLKGLADALADGDHILAVVKGAAMNNDGSHKASYMAPSVDGQSEVITDAQRRADVDPGTIGYVEAHGTATPLGDPIEVAALSRAFGRDGGVTERKVALGSVKSNIGHTDAAAGVAGLIKVVLALTHEAIPPTLHYETPNPEIDFDSSPFYVPTELVPWPASDAPRRAGISSFGVGGTNAHVVLEEAPVLPELASTRPRHLLSLSARSEMALATMRQALADHLETQRPSLADVAYTLTVGRADFSYRTSIVAAGIDGAVEALRDGGGAVARLEVDAPDVVMMFPGQGTQFVGMGRELYEHEPTYRAALDQCASILEPRLGLDLRSVLYPADEADPVVAEQLTRTGLAQPAIFAVSYATAQLWLSWGVRPATLVGHSVGEYVAAAVAGVFSLEDALTIIASRATLMQDLPGGSMRAVRLSPDELATYLGDGVSLAAVNTPMSTVVSGPDDAIRRFEARMQEAGLETIELHTSHAFHSEMMEPILDRFREVIAGVARRAPGIPIVSTVTGVSLTDAEATDPDYWAGQVRRPVRFSDAVLTLHREPSRVYLEVGPGTTLSAAVRQHPNGTNGDARIAVIDSLGHPSKHLPALQPVLDGLGKLWQAGVPVDRVAAFGNERRRRVPLPTYPFERKRHWMDPPPLAVPNRSTTPTQAEPAVPGVAVTTIPASTPPGAPTQERTSRPGRIADRMATIIADLGGLDADVIDRTADFADLGLDSLFLTQANSRIRKEFGVRIPLRSLLNEASTIDALAAHIDAELAPDALPAPVEPSVGREDRSTQPLPIEIDGTRPALVTVADDDHGGATQDEWLVREQLRLMDMQLRLMDKQLDTRRTHISATPGTVGDFATPNAAASLRTERRPVELPVLPNVARYMTERETPHPERWNLDALVTPTRHLDPDVTRRVVGQLVERHDAFRLRYSFTGDVLSASIAVTADPPYGTSDFSKLSPSARTGAVERRAGEIQASLALDRRLVHFELFNLGEQGQRLLVVAHHFVMDQLSWPPFWADFEILYESLERGVAIALPPVTTTFEDWALALQQYADSGSIRAGLPTWRDLPWDHVRPVPLDHIGGANTNESAEEILLVLTSEETEDLLRRTPTIARKVDLMLTALARAIAKWSDTDAVLIDMMGHGRDDGIVDGVDPLETVGFFVSYTPLLLRLPVGGSERVPLTEQIEPLIRRGLDFDLLRYMARDSSIQREFRAWPRAEILFNHHGQRDEPVEVPRSNLFVAALESIGDTHSPEGIRYYPVAVSSEVHYGQLRFNFVYSANLHDRSTIAALVDDFRGELSELVALAVGVAEASVGPIAAGSAARLSDAPASEAVLPAQPTVGLSQQNGAGHEAHIADELTMMVCSLSGLDASTLGRTASFADLGLDSLFLTQLGSQIRKQLGVRVTLGEMLEETPTIEALAKRIEASQGGAKPTALAVVVSDNELSHPSTPPVNVPLTHEQRDIWVASQLSDEGSAAFNLATLLGLRGELDVTALHEALRQLRRRHEALRTTFDLDGEYQVIGPDAEIELPVLDVSNDPEPARSERVSAFFDADMSTPYDLVAGPLFRPALIRYAPDDHVLVLSMHHLVGDGWSFDVMRRELGVIYGAMLRGKPAALDEPTQYREYAAWRIEQSNASRAYWRRHYDQPPVRLELPTDKARPAVRDYEYGHVRTVIGDELLASLKGISAAQGVTLFNVLLTGWETLLHRLSGQPDFAHVVFVSGQPGMGVQSLVGFCTNTLPMRALIEPTERISERLKRSKRDTMDALDNRYFSVEQLATEFRLKRDPSRPSLVSTGVTMESALSGIDFGDLDATGWDHGRRSFGPFDLELYLMESTERLTVDLEYAASLFGADTIELWLGHFVHLLYQIAADASAQVSDLRLPVDVGTLDPRRSAGPQPMSTPST